MTKVTIDIRNIASSTHADDRVLFRSPIHRTGGAGLVSTANEVVTLTDGVGEVELIPGPVIVTFQCKGVTDTSPKRGTVPDTGPVTLGQVISGSFSYSPEVVTAAQAARNGAVEAAGQAKDYRDQTKTYRDQAASSAGLAASSLSGVQDLAADVSDDVAQANSSRDQAVQAASDASTSASQAATARDQAVQAATDTSGALDAALATKADKVHEHTTAQVTGLDTALTNADWYKGTIPDGATLNDLPRGMYQIQGGSRAEQLGLPSRVGSLEIGQSYNGTKTALAIVNTTTGAQHEVWSNSQSGITGEWVGWRKSVFTDPASSTAALDLRMDNTVGTRVFAGDTMIYGDTGRRNIPLTGSWVESSTAGRFTFRRVGTLVEFEGRLQAQESLLGTPRNSVTDLVTPTRGFLPRNIGGGSGFVAGNAYGLVGGVNADGIVRFSNTTMTIHLKAAGGNWATVDTLLVHGVYLTDDDWPTSLPGLPA